MPECRGFYRLRLQLAGERIHRYSFFFNAQKASAQNPVGIASGAARHAVTEPLTVFFFEVGWPVIRSRCPFTAIRSK